MKGERETSFRIFNVLKEEKKKERFMDNLRLYCVYARVCVCICDAQHCPCICGIFDKFPMYKHTHTHARTSYMSHTPNSGWLMRSLQGVWEHCGKVSKGTIHVHSVVNIQCPIATIGFISISQHELCEAAKANFVSSTFANFMVMI